MRTAGLGRSGSVSPTRRFLARYDSQAMLTKAGARLTHRNRGAVRMPLPVG